MKLFIDMDGVLAEWKVATTPEELAEPGYFAGLKPLENVKTIGMLASEFKDEIYILSAVIPDTPHIREEKTDWIKRYLPEIKEDHILFCEGESKRKFVADLFGKVSENDILLDDYSKNLLDWGKSGTSVKFFNGHNGNSGRQYKYSISEGKYICVVENALYLRSLLKIVAEKEVKQQLQQMYETGYVIA